jgi:hypothetical protein
MISFWDSKEFSYTKHKNQEISIYIGAHKKKNEFSSCLTFTLGGMLMYNSFLIV